MSETKRITIGKISRVRGVRGEMVVAPLTDDPDRFSELDEIKISVGGITREFHLKGAKILADRILIQLKEIRTPEEAKLLVGGFIEIEKEELIKPGEGNYFVFDLIGLEVMTVSGDKIGLVKEVIPLPANDIYVVESGDKTYNIPATKNIVKKIDLAKGVMIIELMEGLLEI
jgi:16S rRNA processing protein RimM